ncbi:glycosyl transferase family 28 [Albidovulum inexpectatum]|uniref:Glycosyl transferase family 28 n=1 Tax=Albidovulum inexpectatum TaxID=196587 RepID=A0A2S5JLK1_9RHOB|nr:glycosyltransferase [Albidovulum inexpectatum]PPB82281.1 glycosyl transferase family 28 [Albidovulum inexpectatum]
MILIEAGEISERGMDAKLIVADQLSRLGHRVVLDDRTLPPDLGRHHAYEAAPFAADLSGLALDHLLMLGAETLTDEILLRLRTLDLAPDARMTALGRFGDVQARISAQSRLAFAACREPDIIDLNELIGPGFPDRAMTPLCTRIAHRDPARPPRLALVLTQECFEDPSILLPDLAVMDAMPDYSLVVIAPGQAKTQIMQSAWSGLRVLNFSELMPTALARRLDAVAFLGDAVPGERMATLAIEVLGRGGVVLDATGPGILAGAGAPIVRVPAALAALDAHLRRLVLPNLAEIGRRNLQDDWLVRRDLKHLERALGLEPARRDSVTDQPRRTLFFPTNGVGLGHARRAVLVAGEVQRGEQPVFAAFPSCVDLVRQSGFPCLPLVQRSDRQPQEHANDILTWLRLRRVLRRGDRLVFDGGYVFDSVHRVIHERDLDAVWIRRGLFQPGAGTPASADRASDFRAVIVPSEAFDELNAPVTGLQRVHRVGPIVDLADPMGADERETRRSELSRQLGRGFDQLVVSMLGAGVAADRSAQLQLIAALCDGQPGCLHLAIIWPGGAVPPGLSRWPSTRVVQTRHALALCRIADAVVSAAGYNSFHELLYHRVPAIFIPQMAPFMDDQERRTRAAADRGLAVTVGADEFLQLERELVTFLRGETAGRLAQALASVTLPAPGTRDAARIVCGDDAEAGGWA